MKCSFSVRTSKELLTKFDNIAKNKGLTRSAYVQILIYNEIEKESKKDMISSVLEDEENVNKKV